MAKLLVCLNDNLLKIRISRVLTEKKYQFDITDKPIRRDDLIRYDIVIIHSTYHLNNLFGFIENAVLSKLSTIIYITSNINSNPFRRFIDHPNLIFVDENKMDIELPLTISVYKKYETQFTELNKENKELSKNLENINLMNKCKRMLISKGYSESDAHKYILKFAMDNHIDKNEACNRLLAGKGE